MPQAPQGYPASMEPTFIQRRKGRISSPVFERPSCFNGADVYSTSEGLIGHTNYAYRNCFNGADVYSTSEGSSKSGSSDVGGALQWSRRLFNVGRSNGDVRWFVYEYLLQWSRRLFNVGRLRRVLRRLGGMQLLQWSRRLFNVGRYHLRTARQEMLQCFNGADVYSTSEGTYVRDIVRPRPSASMEPTFIQRRKGGPPRRAIPWRRASMEPTFIQRRKAMVGGKPCTQS